MIKIDFSKGDGLIPAIIQDVTTRVVLMQGYMNQEAFDATMQSGKVTFFSRSKQRLWTKGETTGHFLILKSVAVDCDNDSLLIQAEPQGVTCHTGADTCWNETNEADPLLFLRHLEGVIRQRHESPSEASYTSQLFARGINKVAQKVGEEAVELVIESKDDNRDLFKGEAADLLFHLLVLFEAKGIPINEVIDVLKSRH
jgi:phosphoribosyl-ATP pyrophosphohydrolase/phosphoribosyl-AMP cyclohydrolase